MFTFSLKPKKIVLHTFLPESCSYIATNFPVTYATKYYPEWWKKLPTPEFDFNNMVIKPNMKSCIGFTELYQNSAVLPLWSDLAIKWDLQKEIWFYQFADKNTRGDSHGRLQRDGFKMDHFNFKINSPWKFFSDKDVYFNISQLYYNFPQKTYFDILPGVVEYYYQNRTNINIFLRPDINQIIIPHNTPLFLIRPLSERKLEIKMEVLNENDYYKLDSKKRPFSFMKAYINTKNNIKNQEKKCPFGFIK